MKTRTVANYIKNMSKALVILPLFTISFNVLAHVKLQDSARNLLNAKLTTLIDINEPISRVAYGHVQLGQLGMPQTFLPGRNSEFIALSNLVNNYAKEGDILYSVFVLVSNFDRTENYPQDVLLPKFNKYKILRSETQSEDGSYPPYYHLTTSAVHSWKEGSVKKEINLHIFVTRYKVSNYKGCKDYRYSDLKEWCKEQKEETLIPFEDRGDFSIQEVTSVLKSIVEIDLSTIPVLVIPKNN